MDSRAGHLAWSRPAWCECGWQRRSAASQRDDPVPIVEAQLHGCQRLRSGENGRGCSPDRRRPGLHHDPRPGDDTGGSRGGSRARCRDAEHAHADREPAPGPPRARQPHIQPPLQSMGRSPRVPSRGRAESNHTRPQCSRCSMVGSLRPGLLRASESGARLGNHRWPDGFDLAPDALHAGLSADDVLGSHDVTALEKTG